jgi:putative DNA primase/helicase
MTPCQEPAEPPDAAMAAPVTPTLTPAPWKYFDETAPGLLEVPKGTPADDGGEVGAPGGIEPEPDDADFLAFTPEPHAVVPKIWEFPANDDGRAAFVLAHIGAIVRYVPELSLWRVWHGHRWHDDKTGRVGHYCQLLSRHAIKEAAAFREELMEELEAEHGAKSPKEAMRQAESRARQAKQAAASLGQEKVIASTMAAASRFPEVIVPLVKWDADPWLAGTRNGTLDLKNVQHREGNPGDYITKQLAVGFEAGATAPDWERFMSDILPEDLLTYIQSLAGYSLTGITDDQAFYCLNGKGCNGKSVLVSTLARIFGDYAKHAPRNLIEQPAHGGSCKNEIAELPGVRFLYGEEAKDRLLREDLIKALTSGTDTLTGEKKFCNEFSFGPVAKLWLMGNERPTIRGTDDGIWRRVRLIPFEIQIEESKRLPHSELMAKFGAERPGILNWMLRGLAARGTVMRIPVPAAVKAASAEYREEQDTLADFITDCTEDAAPDDRVPKAALLRAYRSWADRNGIRDHVTNTALTRRLLDRAGWRMTRDRRYWLGKALRAVPDDAR